MKCFSMFSGIGGFDLALKNLGHEIVGACEIDKYARQIYENHFLSVPVYHDATKLQPESLPQFDLLCGGFPCQAFSVAGKRLGFNDSRGTLFFEIARIAKEKRPRYLFLENVRGLLFHDKGQTMRTIIGILDELGYDAEWQVINSKYFVPQNRERVFIIGHLRGERTRQVFPLGEINSVSEKKKAREQGKRSGIRSQDYSSTIDARYGALRNSGETYLMYLSQTNSNMKQRIQQRDTTWTLTNNCSDFGIIENKMKVLHQSKSQAKRIYDPEGLSQTLSANGGGQGAKTGLYNINSRVRRLTPLECERLQGFPDGYTKGISDTQRYKCLGNAVTVPVVQYIAKELKI